MDRQANRPAMSAAGFTHTIDNYLFIPFKTQEICNPGTAMGDSSNHNGVGVGYPTFIPNTGPSILNLQDTETTMNVVPAQHLVTAEPTDKAQKDKVRVSDATWNKFKTTINELYLENTLDMTMAIMQTTHKFFAPKKAYKDRLKSWGCVKYLKKDNVLDIVKKTGPRCGRQTEIVVGQTKFDIDRVRRSYNRLQPRAAAENSCNEPTEHTDIIVRTPEAENTDLSHPVKSLDSLSDRAYALPFKVYSESPLGNNLFLIDGRGLSLECLLQMKITGAELVSQGRLEDATLKFQAVLSGFQRFFVPTHPNMVETGWSLAEAYKMQHNSPQMDGIINWLSSNYSRDLGLWNSRSLLHYIRVVEILQSAGRLEDAKLLGLNIYVAVRDTYSPQKMIPVVEIEHAADMLMEAPEVDILSSVLCDTTEEAQIDRQIKLAKIWAAAQLQGMEEILERRIAFFDTSTPRLRSKTIDFKCILISLHIAQEKYDTASTECKLARDLLAKLILEHRTSILQDFLRQSRDLAALHLSNHDSAGHDRVLQWTANNLQKMVTEPCERGYNYQHIDYFVDHSVQIGIDHQNRSGWGDAQTWFGRAYSLSVRYLGASSTRALALERAFKEQNYKQETLLMMD